MTDRITLDTAVANEVARGGRVESQTDKQAIIVSGRRPNHLLHLVLTGCTLGLWRIVWFGLTQLGSEKHRVVRIDEEGNVTVSPL